MTNKEAIEVIKSMGLIIDATTSRTRRKPIYEALTLAIKALEDRPQGEWIPTVIDTGLFERSVCREWQCSNCGEVVKMKYPFCHCGAKMTKEAENG